MRPLKQNEHFARQMNMCQWNTFDEKEQKIGKVTTTKNSIANEERNEGEPDAVKKADWGERKT